jgi:hypothetical protein
MAVISNPALSVERSLWARAIPAGRPRFRFLNLGLAVALMPRAFCRSSYRSSATGANGSVLGRKRRDALRDQREADPSVLGVRALTFRRNFLEDVSEVPTGQV